MAVKPSPKGSKPKTKREREHAANKIEKQRADARRTELAKAKQDREVDAAMVEWQRAADKAQRNMGPDISTKKIGVKKKPETPAERRARLKARDKRALGFK